MNKPPCRICGGASTLFYKDSRSFYRCGACDLVFTGEMAALPEQEKHYKAQWGNQDLAFWKQQAQVIFTILNNYNKPKRVLDFGSGSGMLTEALRALGQNVTALEPMLHGYLKDQRYPEKFDAIIGVEVIEHLPNLWEELREMEKNLSPGGVMLFTTLLSEPYINNSDGPAHFAKWWYKDDPTHVSFFNYRSLEKLGDLGGFDVDILADQVVVLRGKGED